MRVLAGLVIAALVASAGAQSSNASNDRPAIGLSAASAIPLID